MTAASAAAVRLNVLGIFSVILGHGCAPRADGCELRPNRGKTLQPISLIARQSGPRVGICAKTPAVEIAAIEHRRQRLGVSERVMNAGQIAVVKIVRAAIEQSIV